MAGDAEGREEPEGRWTIRSTVLQMVHLPSGPYTPQEQSSQEGKRKVKEIQILA